MNEIIKTMIDQLGGEAHLKKTFANIAWNDDLNSIILVARDNRPEAFTEVVYNFRTDLYDVFYHDSQGKFLRSVEDVYNDVLKQLLERAAVRTQVI